MNIFQVDGGAGNLKEPMLLILGIPNVGNNFFNGTDPITSVTATNPYTSATSTTGSSALGGTNLYGGTWDTTTGFAGTMTAGSPPPEAYSTVGLSSNPQKPNASNNFTNWAGADLTINNVTATTFSLYVFEITAPLGAKGVVSVQFPTTGAGALPLGTYAIAYGIIQTTDKHGNTSTKIYDTPFTQAGLTTGNSHNVTGVPAPPSVILLGVGGLIVAGALARSRRRLAIAA